MKLNWFSPLPPAKTGIARYTADLLPALCARAEVTLWTEQEEWDSQLNDHARVRRYHSGYIPWREINEAELSVYNIGNNHHFHFDLWLVSTRSPGLVVLHDLRLHHFFAGVFHARLHNRNAYLAPMQRYYGEKGREDGKAFWAGTIAGDEMARRYTLHRLATDSALAVLAHTPESCEALRAEDGPPAMYAPLPYIAKPRPAIRAKKVGGDLCRLVVFGHLGSNRRLEVILEALAGLVRRAEFRLEVCGEIWNEEMIRERVRSLGLENLVRLRGHVSDADLDAALDAADLALNLRNPTMGEASLSQLQIWDHALPSLVTQLGWYATLPKDAVAFVRPEHEVADISAHLKRFRQDRARFLQMGRNGRSFLEDVHSCDAYVDQLLGFAKAAPAARRRHLALDLATRVGEECSAWSAASLAEPLLRRVAAEIQYLLLAPKEVVCRPVN